MRARPEASPRGWPSDFGRGAAEREALLRIAQHTVAPRRVHELAWRAGSARGVRAELGSEGEPKRAVDHRSVRDRLQAAGGRLLTPAEDGYPPSLLDLPDPPGWLFVRGRTEVNARAHVAVVGARGCSPYGREMATVMGRGLGAAGVCVVSGAARGIDGAAHRGALLAGGPTIAVLGSGIDVAYPRSHTRLLQEIAEAGMVVSEYPPGTPAAKFRFPARNRIVAALADVVVVIEGAVGSGSLITVEFAQDLGREVGAVPGPVTSPLSSAPLDLLRDGAALIRGPDDVLDLLGIPRGDRPGADALDLGADEQRVLEGVAGDAVTVDALAAALTMSAGKVLPILAALEIKGLVRADGGRYRRTMTAPAPSG